MISISCNTWNDSFLPYNPSCCVSWYREEGLGWEFHCQLFSVEVTTKPWVCPLILDIYTRMWLWISPFGMQGKWQRIRVVDVINNGKVDMHELRKEWEKQEMEWDEASKEELMKIWGVRSVWVCLWVKNNKQRSK